MQPHIDALTVAPEISDSAGSLPPSTTTGGGTQPAAPAGSFDAEGIADALVVHQYSYVNSIKRPWVFLVVENTSEYTLSISADLKTFGAEGGVLGAKSSSADAVGAGQTTIIVYMLDEAFETSEYEVTVSEETWYTPVTQNLAYESSSASKKEIVTVTNNGDIAAEFVEAHVLFFSGEALVGYDSMYFTDDDSELKPGKSITKEVDCYDAYDSFVVVLTGRA
jgi:archaellum component FlaF (FlaF/FlaG flagellin family)